MTYTHAKGHVGQRSVSSKDSVETDRWTDRGHCITSGDIEVGKKWKSVMTG